MNLRPCLVPVLSFDRQAQEFWNAAMTHSGTPIDIPGCDARFSFQVGAPPGAKKIGFSLTLAEGPTLFAIIGDFDFPHWTDTAMAYAEINSLPATIRKAIDLGILDLLRSKLPQEIEGRIGDVQPMDPAKLTKAIRAAPVLWLDIALTLENAAPVQLTIGLRPGELPAILGAGQVHALVSGPGDLSEIPVPLRYSLGELRLDMDELARLETGDLLLLDAQTSTAVLYVTAPHARYGFSRTEKRWTCSGVWPLPHYGGDPKPDTGGSVMEEDDYPELDIDDIELDIESDDPDEPEPDIVGAIPIMLDFEIGRHSVPVGQLAQWQPGTIVELDPPRLDDSIEVIIRANGQRIGSGDLVRVGERLAVRIARLGGMAGWAAAGNDPEDES